MILIGVAMKNKYFNHQLYFTIFFTLAVFGEVSAQFDTNLFIKKALYWPESIVYMGDQNNDGYDDFFVTQMDSSLGIGGKLCFFYGGNPVSVVPALVIPNFSPKATTGCDVNRDGYRDLIVQRYGTSKPPVIDIYFGGPGLDSIPDYSFTHHDNRTIYLEMCGKSWPIDFNGDGFEEFVFQDGVKNPGSSYSINRYFFCETNTVLTTRDYHIFQLYPDTNYQLITLRFSAADLDGDGRDDFTIIMSKKYAPAGSPVRKRWFIYGNSDFSFENYHEFTDTIQYVDHMYLVQDLNDDGKGELVLANQGTHPYWFTEVMSFGTRPPNITPEYGLNTELSIWDDGFSPGDVNNDGYNDFIRKVPYSSMFLYLGGSPMWVEKRRAYGTSSSYYNLNFGGRVGDVNGDGIDDFCIGENGYTDHSSSPPGNLYIIAGSDVPNGIKEDITQIKKESGISVKLSPNPVKKVTNVSYNLPFDGELTLELHDITGQSIYKNILQKEEGDHTELLDLSRLTSASGVYILTLNLKQADKILTKSLKLQYMK
jgi:hypothetical protein